jgi:hypothetical protein
LTGAQLSDQNIAVNKRDAFRVGLVLISGVNKSHHIAINYKERKQKEWGQHKSRERCGKINRGEWRFVL